MFRRPPSAADEIAVDQDDTEELVGSGSPYCHHRLTHSLVEIIAVL